MKRVAIFGAGIGGLTVAHNLAKTGQYSINIYESRDAIGGMARSARYGNCASEYCWRVFFGFYNNVFRIMRDIPLIENPQMNVTNNLIPYVHKTLQDRNIKLRDHAVVYFNILRGLTSCDARMNDEDETWWQGINMSSKSGMYREIGPWLGMDRYMGSFKSVIKVGIEMQMLNSIFDPKYRDYITDQPTSEAWFDHWQQHLTDQGVIFNFNSKLEYVDVDNGICRKCSIKKNDKIELITADIYVLSIPVSDLRNIINKNIELQVGDFVGIHELAKKSLHVQLSFQIYFDREIKLGKNKSGEAVNAVLPVESAWDLIILSYDQAYNWSKTSLCGNSVVKGGWSVAVCTAYIPGIIYGKPFLKCSLDEIKTEIIQQMTTSQSLRDLIRQNNDFDFQQVRIIKWQPLWPSYYYENGTLKTTEYKFTNNAGTIKLRPSYKTPFVNMYISTAYTRETIDIYSMEAAAISGNYVSAAIHDSGLAPIITPRPLILEPFRRIDNRLYRYNLPNVTVCLVWLILIIIMVFIIVKLLEK